MQFHLNGYAPGDPLIDEPHPSVAERPAGLPDEVDVLIVGQRPGRPGAGGAARQLPRDPTVVVDRRDGPLQVGQADGVACRTVEMFEAFGLAERLVERGLLGQRGRLLAARPRGPEQDHAHRARQDTEDGLSEFPHVIVNQARMLAYLLDHMERSPSRLGPTTASRASDVEVDRRTRPVDGRRCAATCRRRDRPRRSAPGTSSAATARAAACARRSAASSRRRDRTTPGA